MGKYLFYDIDGTLMGPSRKVTEKTKWAIEEAKRQGHRAFLCTGRAPTSISDDLKEIDWEKTKALAVRGNHIYLNIKAIKAYFTLQTPIIRLHEVGINQGLTPNFRVISLLFLRAECGSTCCGILHSD